MACMVVDDARAIVGDAVALQHGPASWPGAEQSPQARAQPDRLNIGISLWRSYTRSTMIPRTSILLR